MENDQKEKKLLITRNQKMIGKSMKTKKFTIFWNTDEYLNIYVLIFTTCLISVVSDWRCAACQSKKIIEIVLMSLDCIDYLTCAEKKMIYVRSATHFWRIVVIANGGLLWDCTNHVVVAELVLQRVVELRVNSVSLCSSGQHSREFASGRPGLVLTSLLWGRWSTTAQETRTWTRNSS